LDVCGFLLVLLHTDIEGLASLGWLRDRKWRTALERSLRVLGRI
jgi:hypothetical protein